MSAAERYGSSRFASTWQLSATRCTWPSSSAEARAGSSRVTRTPATRARPGLLEVLLAQRAPAEHAGEVEQPAADGEAGRADLVLADALLVV